jgi:hypothetical protein
MSFTVLLFVSKLGQSVTRYLPELQNCHRIREQSSQNAYQMRHFPSVRRAPLPTHQPQHPSCFLSQIQTGWSRAGKGSETESALVNSEALELP